MIRGFHYRFYPTTEQKTALAKTFGCVRYVYNWALNLRTTAWRERQERITYGATSAALTELKRQPDVAWLNEVSCVPVQQALRHLQTAFVNFWQNGAAYPNFKKRDGRQSAEFTRSAFQWDGKILTLAKIGELNIRWSRSFTRQPTTIYMSRTPTGRYYVSFHVDEPLPVLPKGTGQVGIDLGLTCFAVFSDGSKHYAPRPLRRKMAQLKRAQKAFSRKQKGSKNRSKAKLRVAKIHQKISDIRRDDLQQLSTRLIRENQVIAVEDLNVRGMMANHSLAGAIGDSGWSELVRMLEYKSAWHGRTFVRIDRWFPSSKLCSACGVKNVAISLDVREWRCPACGVTHDRDINAALNILAVGLADSNDRGDGVRPQSAKTGKGSHLRSGYRSAHCAVV
jgi:putative transposase